MPQPKQVNISLIVSDLIISASSRQVEFLIFPRRGSTAWFGALHSLPPPAAESEPAGHSLTISSANAV